MSYESSKEHKCLQCGDDINTDLCMFVEEEHQISPSEDDIKDIEIKEEDFLYDELSILSYQSATSLCYISSKSVRSE